jgi:hypothetical protein
MEVLHVTSRLYRTTRALHAEVELILRSLGIAGVGSPTMSALVGLYITGLILLDVRQTQTRVTHFLPGRCHDALNRLLRTMPLSTRALMRLLIEWAKRQGAGYLSLDDVVVEKAYARKLAWAGWTYSFAKKRKVYGLHIVVLSWCSEDGAWRIPVAFRLWRPKRSVGKADYRTKLELAEQMLKEAVAAGLTCEYIVFDTHYTAGWFTKTLGRLGLTWVGTLDPRTIVVWQGKRQSVRGLAIRPRLKWRKQLRVQAIALTVYAPKYGKLRLVVTRNRHGNYEYIVSNDSGTDLTTLVLRKRSRWSVETVFRDAKQFGGLGACQAWVDSAMVRHVALVMLTFVVLQRLRLESTETVGSVKARWQLEVLRDGDSAPEPLRACPPQLRAATA